METGEGDMDTSRYAQMGKVTYRIASYPAKEHFGQKILTGDQVKAGLRLAFSKWSAASAFDFELTESPAADIVIEFGDFYSTLRKYVSDQDANQVAEGAKAKKAMALTYIWSQATAEIRDGSPTPIVFDDSWAWTTMEADLANWPGRLAETGIVGIIQRTAKTFYVADLVTVAVHEIGHALGLGHNLDSNATSIMRASLADWSNTFSYYMTARSLPDADRRSLEIRYKPVDLPYEESQRGCVIVGSTFEQRDALGTREWQDAENLCWGIDENTPGMEGKPAPLVHGYGYNPRLSAVGYGRWNLHLMPVDKVGNRKFVVGGGVLRPGKGVATAPIPPDGVLKFLADIQGYAPVASLKWGSATSHIQLCARIKAWNDGIGGGDTDSIMYFMLDSNDSGSAAPRLLLQGYYTSVCNEAMKKCYPARQWGKSSGAQSERAYHVSIGRTYPIEKDGTGSRSQYDKANSQTIAWFTIG